MCACGAPPELAEAADLNRNLWLRESNIDEAIPSIRCECALALDYVSRLQHAVERPEHNRLGWGVNSWFTHIDELKRALKSADDPCRVCAQRVELLVKRILGNLCAGSRGLQLPPTKAGVKT